MCDENMNILNRVEFISLACGAFGNVSATVPYLTISDDDIWWCAKVSTGVEVMLCAHGCGTTVHTYWTSIKRQVSVKCHNHIISQIHFHFEQIYQLRSELCTFSLSHMIYRDKKTKRQHKLNFSWLSEDTSQIWEERCRFGFSSKKDGIAKLCFLLLS